MGHLLPALSDAKLRIQKDVVKNEYRQNYANRPYGQVWRLMAEALYPPGHPYSWLTIGVMEDVEAATRDDVEAFFRRFYVPSNASLCLVGDIDEGRGLELAERYFGALPGGARAHDPLGAAVAAGRERRDAAARPRGARPRLPGLADRPPLPRRRRPAVAPGRHPGARQVEPALPQARRRARAGAGRVRLAGRPRAGRSARRHDHAPAAPVARARPGAVRRRGGGDRRGGRPGRRAGAGPERPARRLPLRARHHRRVRRGGRPAQRLQHLSRRPRPDHLGPRALPGGDARGDPRRGPPLPARPASGRR